MTKKDSTESKIAKYDYLANVTGKYTYIQFVISMLSYQSQQFLNVCLRKRSKHECTIQLMSLDFPDPQQPCTNNK